MVLTGAGCRASRPGAGRRVLRRSASPTSPAYAGWARGPPETAQRSGPEPGAVDRVGDVAQDVEAGGLGDGEHLGVLGRAGARARTRRAAAERGGAGSGGSRRAAAGRRARRQEAWVSRQRALRRRRSNRLAAAPRGSALPPAAAIASNEPITHRPHVGGRRGRACDRTGEDLGTTPISSAPRRAEPLTNVAKTQRSLIA